MKLPSPATNGTSSFASSVFRNCLPIRTICSRAPQMIVFVHCRQRRILRYCVDRIDYARAADRVHQGQLSRHISDAQSGQSVHLGKRSEDHQIRVFRKQRHTIGVVFGLDEFTVCLVQHNNSPTIDGVEKGSEPVATPIGSGGVVGIAQNTILVRSSTRSSIPRSSNPKSARGTSLASTPENSATHSATANVLSAVTMLSPCSQTP